MMGVFDSFGWLLVWEDTQLIFFAKVGEAYFHEGSLFVGPIKALHKATPMEITQPCCT